MADIREKNPVKSKVAAGVKNAVGEGMKLAVAVIAEARDLAEVAVKKGDSLKKRLLDLSKLSEAEHVAFCGALEDERKAIGQKAKDAGFEKLTDYFKKGAANGAKDYSVYTSLSTWAGLSTALRLGWKPSDMKMGWSLLTQEATAAKQAAIAAGKGKGPAKPETDAERKAREAKEQAQLVQSTTKAVMGKLTEGEGETVRLTAKGKEALADVVAGIMALASPEEFDAVIARLQSMRQQAVTAREQAGKAIANAARPRDKDADKATIEASVKNVDGSLKERAQALIDKGSRKSKGQRATAKA
jgi:DNA-binding PadR family transcriptional regulator